MCLSLYALLPVPVCICAPIYSTFHSPTSVFFNVPSPRFISHLMNSKSTCSYSCISLCCILLLCTLHLSLTNSKGLFIQVSLFSFFYTSHGQVQHCLVDIPALVCTLQLNLNFVCPASIMNTKRFGGSSATSQARAHALT